MRRSRSRLLRLAGAVAIVAGFGLTVRTASAAAFNISVTTIVDLTPNPTECTGAILATCSLRQAGDFASKAPNGSFVNITVPQATYTLDPNNANIIFSSPPGGAPNTIRVFGANQAHTIVDGANGTGIFDNESANLEVDNLTLTHGNAAGGGGAIRSNVNASLIANNVGFSNNAASTNGGAIDSSSNALSLNHDTFTYNYAGVQGGALKIESSSQSTGSVNASSFQHNAGNGRGGAVSIDAPLTIGGSSFFSNQSDDSGGAVASTNQLQVTGSSFSKNQALDGGAIWEYYSDWAGNQISSTSFSNNRALLVGGAIYNDGGIDNLSQVTMTGNQAGGSILAGVGGAIYMDDEVVEHIDKSTFLNNRVQNGLGCSEGGALDADGFNNSVAVSNTTFRQNRACDGGALYNNKAQVVISDSALMLNSAQQDGGGIYYQAAAESTTAELGINNTRILLNQAQAGGGLYDTGDVSTYLLSGTTTIKGNIAGICPNIDNASSETPCGP